MEHFNFWEKVVDENGEEWYKEVPACQCSDCGDPIYKDDTCYFIDGAPVCDNCLGWHKMTGREVLRAMTNARRRGA